MIDPQRLTASDSTPFESRLLNAARNESIPTEMKLRMSQGLNLGASALGGAGTTAVLSLNTIALVVLGATALLGLAGVVVKQGKETSSPPSVMTAPTPAHAAIEEASAVQPAAPPEAEPTKQALPAQAGARRQSRTSSNDSPTSPTRGRDADLREEIALLDAARTALASGSPHKAMGFLGQYARRYPNGTFVPEALALRIEALTDAGDRASAHALARGFLKAHPSSPLAERVERLAGRGR